MPYATGKYQEIPQKELDKMKDKDNKRKAMEAEMSASLARQNAMLLEQADRERAAQAEAMRTMGGISSPSITTLGQPMQSLQPLALPIEDVRKLTQNLGAMPVGEYIRQPQQIGSPLPVGNLPSGYDPLLPHRPNY